MPTVDRLRRAIEAVVESVLRPRIDYLSMYPSVVVAQDVAGLLEILPDDERFRGQGLTGIAIRHGLPGVTVEVPAGTRLQLGFDAGDPARPYAALWDSGGATKIVINTTGDIELGDAFSSVLRDGEIVTITGVQPGPSAAPCTITLHPTTPGVAVGATGESKVKA